VFIGKKPDSIASKSFESLGQYYIRVLLLVKAIAGDIYHKWFQNSRSNWESLGNPAGGAVTSDSDTVSWGNGRIDFFVRGKDNALWHKWFQNSRSNWESLSGVLTSDPAAVSWGSNRIDVFARGTDYHKWFDGNRWQPL
jgi:repeat uncharacterized protein DUF346